MSSCFKAYDIRGRVPDELNEELAYKIGLAYALHIQPQGEVALGRDVRHTSAGLQKALTRGLNDAGVDTVDIGMCGTETVYYAAGQAGRGGGIMVTASHNPMDYNGMKLVREDAVPISSDSGLQEIAATCQRDDIPKSEQKGEHREESVTAGYIKHLLSLIDVRRFKPLKLVVNAGNGAAGPTFDALAEKLPCEFIRVHHQPNGDFPNGIPNPLLPENQHDTSAAVIKHGADMGIAWDGDFDRCFLFDANGGFVDGYYLVGLLARQLLAKNPDSAVVFDPRLYWYTEEIIREAGGKPIKYKTGHAFIKERMRLDDAIYGGEISGHHYFRDFFYCDSGMLPWLFVTQLMSETGATLNDLVTDGQAAYPCSGEINRRVKDADAVIAEITKRYTPQAISTEDIDGIGMDFGQWRFNLRKSNTEPLLRLNVESRADAALMHRKTEELLALIDA